MALGVYPVANGAEMKQVFNDHQRKANERMALDPLPMAQEDASIAASVYIYNVGPWSIQRDLASMGKKLIHAIPKEKVFDGLTVSEPLVIEGQPWEGYPMEKPVRLFAGRKAPVDRSLIPEGREGLRFRNPGFDLAMEILGYGIGQDASNKIDRYGVFVSEFKEPGPRIEEPKRPPPNASNDVWMVFGKSLTEFKDYDEKFAIWKKQVETAQELLRQYCVEMVQNADNSWKQGTFLVDFPYARKIRAHECSEMIKSDPKLHGWLGDSHSNLKPKQCIACSELLDARAMKCKCGQLQVTQEAFDKEMKLRMEANAA